MSGLGGNRLWEGLDKSFAQVSWENCYLLGHQGTKLLCPRG
jgi:hypothetical protein